MQGYRSELVVFNPFKANKRRQEDPQDPALYQKAELFEPLIYRALDPIADKFGIRYKLLKDKGYFSPYVMPPDGMYYWQFRFGEQHDVLLSLPFSWGIDIHVTPSHYKVVVHSGSLARILPTPEAWYTVRSTDNEIRIKFEEVDKVTFLYWSSEFGLPMKGRMSAVFDRSNGALVSEE